MEKAPIIATEDVDVTIRKAIEQELRNRGFQLGVDTALVTIAADLTRFYNDHKIGFFSGDAIADLEMWVAVKTKGGESRYAKRAIAQGIEPNTQLASGKTRGLH